MSKEKKYVRIDFIKADELSESLGEKIYHLYENGLLVFSNGNLYGKDKHCGENEFYIINPYLNKYKGSERGYWKFQYRGKLNKRYRVLAESFLEVPDELKHLKGTSKLTVDHIDNDSSNDDISNLQWLSLSDNVKKVHVNNRLWTPERRKEYGEAIKKAHAEGKYNYKKKKC